MISPEDTKMLVELYRSDIDDLKQKSGRAILALEKSPSPDERVAVARQAYRHVHSIKGASVTLGFERIATIAHVIEEVIVAIERQVIPPSADVIAILIKTLDMLGDLAATRQPGDTVSDGDETLISQLRNLVPTMDQEAASNAVTGSVSSAQSL